MEQQIKNSYDVVLYMASKVFKDIRVINNSVYINGSILFSSTDENCVAAFIGGLIAGSKVKS